MMTVTEAKEMLGFAAMIASNGGRGEAEGIRATVHTRTTWSTRAILVLTNEEQKAFDAEKSLRARGMTKAADMVRTRRTGLGCRIAQVIRRTWRNRPAT